MRSLAFSFLIVLSAFLAVGLLITFWPTTYSRWVRWSNVENYAPWIFRGWDVYGWRSRIVGIWMGLFGIVAAILTGWIHWFQ